MDNIEDAVNFLRDKILLNGPMTGTVLAGYLSHTTEDLRKTAGRNPEGVLNFVRGHDSVFSVDRDGTIRCLEKTPETCAIDLLTEVLKDKDSMKIHKLVGHLGNAEENVREAGGRNAEGLKNFLLKHPTRFHISEDLVDLTTRAFNKTLDSVQSTDVHGAVLIVLEMFLKNGLYSAPLHVVYDNLTDEEGPYESDDLIDKAHLRKAICQWPIFKIDGFGTVSLQMGKLTNERLLSLFICAALEAEENLTRQELLQRIMPYRITKLVGVDSLISLSPLLDSDRYLKVGSYVGLADSVETQALRFVCDVVRLKKGIPLQKITGHLSQASEEIRDVVGGLSELRTFIASYPDVFSVSASESVSLSENEASDGGGVTLKGVVKELYQPYGTIIVTSGKLTGEEVYFNNSNCTFLKTGDDLTKHLEKGECLSFQISRGRPDGKFKWAAFNVAKTSNTLSPQNGPSAKSASEQNSTNTFAGTVKELYSLWGTVIVTGEKQKGEEVYFSNNNCKFMEKGGNLLRHVNKGQSLSFQITAGVAGGKYKWAAVNVGKSLRSSPSKTVNEDNSQGKQDKGMNTLEGTLKEVNKAYGIITVRRGHLSGQDVYFNNGYCEFMPKGGDLTKYVKKGQSLSFKVCKGYEGSKYSWVANSISIIPPLCLPKEGCEANVEGQEHEFEIIKHTVILLRAQGELAISSLRSTLKEVIPARAKEPISEGFLTGILSKYNIFEQGKTTVFLKGTPEEGRVSVIGKEYSTIRNTANWEKVLYYPSAVHIPPEAHMTNELDYQLKLNSSVNFIAVRTAQSTTPLRAVLVWPSVGPNMNRLADQLASPTQKVLPPKVDNSKDKVSGKVTPPTNNTGSEGTDLITTHIELLKNVVLALLQNGKMTVEDLFKLSQQKMSGNMQVPKNTTGFQQLLDKYDLFRIERNTVELVAQPMTGCISFLAANSNGFINNTPDKKDAFFRRHNIFVRSGGQACCLTVKANVLFYAVQVTSLPEKVQGNRIAPYRCVLVWPEGQILPRSAFQASTVVSDSTKTTKEDRTPIMDEVIGSLVKDSTSSSKMSSDDLSFAVLREAILLLLAAGPIGLAEMCKLLIGSSTNAACRKFTTPETLRQFLMKYGLFRFVADTVALSVTPKEACISQITGNSTGFLCKHRGQKDVAFDESAIHPENVGEIKVGTVVNFIPMDDPDCSNARDGMMQRAVLLWSKDSLLLQTYNAKATEVTGAFTNILNTPLDLSFLVSLVLKILRCNDISRLKLTKWPWLPDVVSGILKDATLCRLYTHLHPSLLNLANDGMTLSLVNVPSDVSSLMKQNAMIVSVSEDSAAAECSDGMIFIERKRFMHCRKGKVLNEKEGEDDMTSLVCVGDEVSCMAVHHLAPVSLPAIVQNSFVTWDAILAWPTSCGESLEVMFSDYRNINSVLAKDKNLCDQTHVCSNPRGDCLDNLPCSGKAVPDTIPDQSSDSDMRLNKECVDDCEKKGEIQLEEVSGHCEDQLLLDIPRDIQLRTVLNVFVACLETDGVLFQDVVNLLNSKSNTSGMPTKPTYTADTLRTYVLEYRHIFEMRSGRIYLVDQFAPGDLVVKTSGEVYAVESDYLHIKTDGTPCKTIMCRYTDIVHKSIGKPRLTDGDVVHLIVTSGGDSSASWRVLLAWPDGAVQEFREGFLLLGKSRSQTKGANAGKSFTGEQSSVLHTAPMTSKRKEKEVSESSQDMFHDIDGTRPYFCVPVFGERNEISECISSTEEGLSSEETSEEEAASSSAEGDDDEKPIPELLSSITLRLEGLLRNFAQSAKGAGDVSLEVQTKRVQEITEQLSSLLKEQKDPEHTATQGSEGLHHDSPQDSEMWEEPLKGLPCTNKMEDMSFSEWMNRRKGRGQQAVSREPDLRTNTCDIGCQTEMDISPASNANPNVGLVSAGSQTFSTGHIIITRYQ